MKKEERKIYEIMLKDLEQLRKTPNLKTLTKEELKIADKGMKDTINLIKILKNNNITPDSVMLGLPLMLSRIIPSEDYIKTIEGLATALIVFGVSLGKVPQNVIEKREMNNDIYG